MNDETEELLKRLAKKKEIEQAMTDNKPAVEKQAVEDYRLLGAAMKTAVSDFNAGVLAQKTHSSIRLDGPEYQYEYIYYVLKFIGGVQAPKGQVLVLRFLNTEQFDQIEMSVQPWQSHYTIAAITEGTGGYHPSQRPQRIGSPVSYKPQQLENGYGWVKVEDIQAEPKSFKKLFDDLTHQLVVSNVIA